MRLQVTVRRGHVNDGVRSYVESKFAKLGKRLHASTLVEVALHLKGSHLRGREAAASFEAATDLLVDKLERLVERERDKKVHEPRRRAQGVAPPEPVPVEEIEQTLRAEG